MLGHVDKSKVFGSGPYAFDVYPNVDIKVQVTTISGAVM